MGGVPRLVAVADAVRMSDLGGALIIAGPVIAGTVSAVGKSTTVRLGAREHIVQVWYRVANTVYLISFLCERECFEHVRATLRFNQRITVNLGLYYWSAENAPGMVPRTIPDSITCVYG
jgi:hypothetical protein